MNGTLFDVKNMDSFYFHFNIVFGNQVNIVHTGSTFL